MHMRGMLFSFSGRQLFGEILSFFEVRERGGKRACAYVRVRVMKHCYIVLQGWQYGRLSQGACTTTKVCHVICRDDIICNLCHACRFTDGKTTRGKTEHLWQVRLKSAPHR